MGVASFTSILFEDRPPLDPLLNLAVTSDNRVSEQIPEPYWSGEFLALHTLQIVVRDSAVILTTSEITNILSI